MLRQLNTTNNKNFKKVPGINRCESKKSQNVIFHYLDLKCGFE